ncbi:Sec17p [Paramicrosporidium saccamoebae]|uniref:Gamma-soluble NSF attachment protein n=1 Tax=Paramicrosporidium saccamoebae TaxID=1246581 RepID=A0A2H9TI54_9FUNG|nr:Sec17p [Paramicrosporidium saccamoebae]
MLACLAALGILYIVRRIREDTVIDECIHRQEWRLVGEYYVPWNVAVARMFFEILLVAGLCYLAHRTRPNPNTFPKHYSTLTTKGVSGLVERLLGGRTQNFIYTDLVLAWMVRTETGLFLGIFGSWIALGETDGVADRIEMGTMRTEDKNAATQREANTLKAAGKYEEASRLFEKTAGRVTSEDPYSAAELYDEAARCRKMVQDFTGYEALTIKAAELFKARNRGIRAAGLYDKLAKHYMTFDSRDTLLKAKDYFGKSRDLYEIESDSRAEALGIEIISLHAKLGEYRKAADGFVDEAGRIFQKDAMFVNQSQRCLLFAVACLALDDEVLCCRQIATFAGQYSWFANSREGKWALKLSDALRQVPSNESYVETLEGDLRMMASMPAWFERAWSILKDRLESHSHDLT